MTWTTTDIPELAGRTVVITGANGGLGLETARALAGAHAHVVMAARDQKKASSALASIRSSHPESSLEIVELDLASLDSVVVASNAINSSHHSIDILINNAGLMAMPESRTKDGFEMQFGVNHLGHWALTAQLLPGLLRAGPSRVVTVTSFARLFSKSAEPGNPHLEGRYTPWGAYGQAKLANYHFALGLQSQFDASRVVSAASLLAHPGLTNTDLQANMVRQGGAKSSGEFWHFMARLFGMSPSLGAMPQVRAATDNTARGGQLYAPRFGFTGPAVRRPILRQIGLHNAIRELWEISERETGLAIRLS